ncbi:MAG: carbohydrate kinase family protein [Deltaproteobacteria bacterium]|nr:MAG: carbohydrate kinase family protein [Deltaproteobacteria bacterium]
MKNIIISGSLAYDRIMAFADKFSNHVLSEKIDNLSVCFQVDGITEKLGGTAGNIAYALKLMGGEPRLTATIGSDYQRYFDWFKQREISTEGIVVIPEEYTAGAYITSDANDNQITCFNPGAMKFSSGFDFDTLRSGDALCLVSPGNLDDMINYPKECEKRKITCIFDPGQALPVLSGDDLVEVISKSSMLVVNDYEFNLILEKTSYSRDELLKLAKTTIITQGDKGSDVYLNGTAHHVAPCQANRVVDPTGAGDAFRGGLLYGLLNEKDLLQSARLGSACASFAVECSGTQEYSFTEKQFQQRLATIK